MTIMTYDSTTFMTNFLSLADVTDLPALIQSGRAAKANPFADEALGRQKTIGLIFFNSSLRTRLSTEKAARNLGLNVMTLNVGTDSWGLELEDGALMNGTNAEHVREAAAVIGRYCDLIGIRAFAGLQDRELDYAERVMTQFERFAGRPIINLESATRHPLQSLADCITIQEATPTLASGRSRPKVVLTWLPHFKPLPQAVANSFCEWMNAWSALGAVDFVVTHPAGYELAPQFIGNAPVIYDQAEALRGADFVYGKNWSSYTHYGQVLTQSPDWRITMDKLQLTDNGRFMHCLPVRRNLKVDDAVLDSPQSLVIEQAANREWAAQAVLRAVLLNPNGPAFR
jgi:N-succinyl-L-ornithine transcarbamylase